MENGVQFKIRGIDGLSKRLKGMSGNALRDASRPAVRKAMNVVKDDAIRRAMRLDRPNTPNSIYKNIALRTNWRSKSKTMVAKVGVLGGAKENHAPTDAPGGDTFYWRFVEFGTSRSRARPFLRPALDQNQADVLQTVIEAMIQQINRSF